jgi:hypothetical protein
MVLVKATKDSEAGKPPSEQLIKEMSLFNQELLRAGVRLAAEGLQPTSAGKRVRFSGSTRSVVDGPFAETKELLAGFWLWEVKSMDEALDWVKRCPNPHNDDGEIEIRPVYDVAPCGASGEIRAAEGKLREQVTSQR